MTHRRWQTLSILAVAPLLAACGESDSPAPGAGGTPQQVERGKTMAAITISSPAFVDGQPIPAYHTVNGPDVSPLLRWTGVPDGTQELALICDDPDAPTPQPWVHWVIYKIPGDTMGLPEQVPTTGRLQAPVGALQGLNSWDTVGYRGPAPPPGHGTHHYHFKLYALDAKLNVAEGLDVAALGKAMDGHILAEGELIGTYER